MNLSHMITRGSNYFGEEKALVYGTTSYTYRELNARVDRVAHYLREQGISRGDRVALYMINCPEWIMVYYGIVRLGAAVVCVSAAYKSSELEHLIDDSQSALLITSESLLINMPDREKFSHLKDVLILEEDDILSSIAEKSRSRQNTSNL